MVEAGIKPVNDDGSKGTHQFITEVRLPEDHSVDWGQENRIGSFELGRKTAIGDRMDGKTAIGDRDISKGMTENSRAGRK